MDPKEELKLMAEEVQCAGIFTRFHMLRFQSFWQARVISVVGEQDEIIILGTGVGPTEESACANCLSYWANKCKNPVVPNAGSLEELRLKLSIRECACGTERQQSERTAIETVSKMTYVKYKALRKEIDGMLSVLSGDWQVEELCLNRTDGNMWHSAVVAVDKNILLVSGKGRTKAEALEKLLENWREGQSEPYVPAAGSTEELRLKLAIEKG